MKTSAIMTVRLSNGIETCDLEIPLDISANNLILAIYKIFYPDHIIKDFRECFLRTENPIALLHGSKTLDAFGLHNGTIINLTEQHMS